MPPAALSLEFHAVSHASDGAPMLRDFSLAFAPATMNVLAGDASCGAIVRLAGLREVPDAGDVLVGGESTRALAATARMDLRNRRFGYLFAAPYLLPAMAVLENVAVPLFKIAEVRVDEARERTEEVLEFVGLAGTEHINVGELSAARQQRVALARALVLRPAFLIVEHADAGATPEEVACFLALLRAVPARFGATVIAALASSFPSAKDDRMVFVQGGAVCGDSLRLPAGESSPS
jgi:ABC-type polar amino acid transport system ATPase subunit